MSLLDLFRRRNTAANNTAAIAKERLQIIVAHQRNQSDKLDFMPQLQQELIEVISRYVKVDRELVKVALERGGDCSVLELNITLPE